MRRVWIAAVCSCFALGACANILGIDDGTPRAYDASDEAGDAAADASDASSDVAVDVPFSPLTCGPSTTCNFDLGQACCRESDAALACVSDAAACSGGTYIPCDRASQCPAIDGGKQLCCTTDILLDGGTYVAQSVGCHPEAQCSPIPTHYILCGDDSGADCPPEAGCAQSVSTLPPFLLCK